MSTQLQYSEPVEKAPPLSAQGAQPACDTAREAPSFRTAAIAAGVGILLLSVLAGFGTLVAVKGLVTPGDAARTAREISGSETLFRFGIVSLLLTAIVDVVVAWGLYRVFQPANAGLSVLAAWFRLAYAATFLVAVSQLLGALRLLDGQGHNPAFTTAQSQSQALTDISAFNDIWIIGLVLFGVHLLLVGYLAYKSQFFPNYLAALICLAGAGYSFDGLIAVLSSDSVPAVSSFTFIGEFALALWLLFRGRRLAVDGARAQAEPVK